MNAANKRENIREEMERASQAMDVADLLFRNGFVNDAVSKLYFSVLYHVRAILLTEGLEPRSHEGALRLLGLHFVKKGLLGRQISHIFSKLMKFREEADYNPSYVFASEDFVELRREAQSLADHVRAYLKEKGYL